MISDLKPGLWELDADGKSLRRKFTCRNFRAAVAFVNAAAEVAEREDIKHHPDLHLTQYRDVEVVVSTHAVGALTEFDLKLAKALESIPIDYSPKWLKAHPEAVESQY